MERDEETGLQRHGVRLLATWLGRWASADPIGVGDGLNRFAYARARPAAAVDRSGFTSNPPQEANLDVDEDADEEPVSVPEAPKPRAHVVLFTGGVENVGSSGKPTEYPPGTVDTTVEIGEHVSLRSPHLDVRVHVIQPGWFEGKAVALGRDRIIEDYRPGDSVVVYGYSRGGQVAVGLAEELEGKADVSALITVDSALGRFSNTPTVVDRSVSENVPINYNFFESDSPDYYGSTGGPNTAARPGSTWVRNYETPGVDHAEMDEFVQDVVENIIVFEINQATSDSSGFSVPLDEYRAPPTLIEKMVYWLAVWPI